MINRELSLSMNTAFAHAKGFGRGATEKEKMGRGEKIIKSSRNLPKSQLGAVIFGCNHHTFSECLNRKIFGLPDAHYSYVKNIDPGLVLFLFDYSDRSLHGIFKAVSRGQMNFDNQAWASCEGVDYSLYAAQVQMDLQTKCRPLIEDEFKPIIGKNYYSEKLFWFELDKNQTRELTQLFLSKPLPEQIMPLCPPNQINMFDALSNSDADDEFDNLEKQSNSGGADMKLKNNLSYASILNSTHSNKKWSDFFRASSSSHQETSEPHVFDSHALEEDGGPREIYEHGTCIICTAGVDCILLLADGRTSITWNKGDKFDSVLKGNKQKLIVIGSKLIVGIAGLTYFGRKLIDIVLNDLEDTNISEFARVCGEYIDDDDFIDNLVFDDKYIDDDEGFPFEIIAVGYFEDEPWVYVSTEGLELAEPGMVFGIGSGFDAAAEHLEKSDLVGKQQEAILSLVQQSFIEAKLKDPATGGYLVSGILGLEIDATLKKEGHIIELADSTFEALGIWDRAIIIQIKNNFTDGYFKRVDELILSDFPGFATFGLFGVIRRDERSDIILFTILYETEEKLLADKVNYGKRADLDWQPKIIKPEKKVFEKYSRYIKNVFSESGCL